MILLLNIPFDADIPGRQDRWDVEVRAHLHEARTQWTDRTSVHSNVYPHARNYIPAWIASQERRPVGVPARVLCVDGLENAVHWHNRLPQASRSSKIQKTGFGMLILLRKELNFILKITNFANSSLKYQILLLKIYLVISRPIFHKKRIFLKCGNSSQKTKNN